MLVHFETAKHIGKKMSVSQRSFKPLFHLLENCYLGHLIIQLFPFQARYRYMYLHFVDLAPPQVEILYVKVGHFLFCMLHIIIVKDKYIM